MSRLRVRKSAKQDCINSITEDGMQTLRFQINKIVSSSRSALLRTAILVRLTHLVGFFAFLAMSYFLCVGVGQTANSVSAYKVTPISPPPGFTNVVPTDINNHGQIVGYGFNGTTTQPFIADTQTFTPIALPPRFVNGFGMAINGSGQVTGYGEWTAIFPFPPADQAFKGGIGGITSVFPLDLTPPPDGVPGDLGVYGFDIN